MAIDGITPGIIDQYKAAMGTIYRLGHPTDITSIRLNGAGNESTEPLDSYRDRVTDSNMGKLVNITLYNIRI